MKRVIKGIFFSVAVAAVVILSKWVFLKLIELQI